MSDLLVNPEIFFKRIENFGYEYLFSLVRRLTQGRRCDKTDIIGMSPLSFIAFFMLGQLDTMFTSNAIFPGGPGGLIDESGRAPPILFSLR
jgi:hypothetical protein